MDRLEEIEERWMCRFDDNMPPGAWTARQDKLIKEDVPWMIEQLKSWQDGNPAIVQEVEDLRASLKRAEEERDGLKDKNDRLRDINNDLKEENSNLFLRLEERGKEVELLRAITCIAKIDQTEADLAACREELALCEQRDEVWRGKKEMLENDLAKAWEKLERYERAMGPVVKMKRWMRKIGNWPIAGPERDYTIKNRNSEAWEACKNATRLLDSGKVTESVTKGE